MEEYRIVQREDEVIVHAENAEDALITFATNMDSDMNIYFEAERADYSNRIISDNEYGTIYRKDKHFNVYCLRQRLFKDGTANWLICIESAHDPERHMTIMCVRGTKEEAQEKCQMFL